MEEQDRIAILHQFGRTYRAFTFCENNPSPRIRIMVNLNARQRIRLAEWRERL